MTDIVEALQPYASRTSILAGTPPELLRRACAEIVQLRTDLAVAVKVGGEMTAEVQRLRRFVERSAALSYIMRRETERWLTAGESKDTLRTDVRDHDSREG